MSNFLAWVPGPMEWIIILIVALLLFGRRLPEVAKGLGKSLSEFKKGIKEGSEESKTADTYEKKPADKA
jgi:sec-independent protein translocase protein TatA